MSLLGAIGTFATGTYTVTRRAAGSYSAGLWVPGATSTFSIVASVQPVSGRELLALPENQRTQELRVVYTATELRTRTGSSDPDTISIDGETWEVARVERWQNGTRTTHYRAFAARQVVS